jgi:pyrimidine operon attenuation protein / uracil phosphoribosyltransferase
MLDTVVLLHGSYYMSITSLPDAEALYARLHEQLKAFIGTQPVTLVGITTGGVWIAERLHRDLKLPTPLGIISSALHRDDYSTRGMTSPTAGASAQTSLPFDVNGADILLIDDVLHTGRTIRAVINELYDFGRPKRVSLAVLVDRGERELPIQADVLALKTQASHNLRLQRDASSMRLHFEA